MHQRNKGKYHGQAEYKCACIAYAGKEGGGGQLLYQRHNYAGAEQGSGGFAENVGMGHGAAAKHYKAAYEHHRFLYYYHINRKRI